METKVVEEGTHNSQINRVLYTSLSLDNATDDIQQQSTSLGMAIPVPLFPCQFSISLPASLSI